MKRRPLLTPCLTRLPEDVLGHSIGGLLTEPPEDHAADALRYLLMALGSDVIERAPRPAPGD